MAERGRGTSRISGSDRARRVRVLEGLETVARLSEGHQMRVAPAAFGIAARAVLDGRVTRGRA